MTAPKKGYYTEIVDEFAHAMSEAFDVPQDIELLEQEHKEDAFVGLTREVTENECRAYGIEDPDTAFAIVSLFGSSPKLNRMIVDNSRGQLNSMLAFPKRFFLDYYQDWKSTNSFGVNVAYFIGVCQARDGYEFDDNCLDVKNELRMPGAVPRVVRRIVHGSLLQPDVDLNDVADGIDRAMAGSTRFVAKNLVDCPLLDETLAELNETLEGQGLRVDSETAARWIDFCGKRSACFDSSSFSVKHAYLQEAVFQDIDKAVQDHEFFSALINGPAD